MIIILKSISFSKVTNNNFIKIYHQTKEVPSWFYELTLSAVNKSEECFSLGKNSPKLDLADIKEPLKSVHMTLQFLNDAFLGLNLFPI